MPMLHVADAVFSVGRARFEDGLPAREGASARIYVKIEVAGLDAPILALLDTGSEYSVLAPEIAEEVGLDTVNGEPITFSYRGGVAPGKLVRTTLTMVADEGDSLAVDATVFIPDPGWPAGRTFIGYSGFLSHVRIGLDPQHNDIYFGGYDE